MENKKQSKNYIALIIMIILSIVSQILTLARTSVVAKNFGATSAMDAFGLSNSVATLIFGFITAGISTIIIPSYINKEKKHVDSFITLIYGIISIVVVLIILFRYQIVGSFSNRDDVYIGLACDILIIILAAQFFQAIINITAAFFQSENRFNIPKIINLFSQIFVIVLLLVFKNLTIIEYTFIVAGGILFNFIFDIAVAFFLGWRYKPSFHFNNSETKIILKKFIPIMISAGVYQLSLFIDTLITERLGVGKISILSYSTQIISMVQTVVIGNLMIYIYPKIIKGVKEKSEKMVFWNQTEVFYTITIMLIAGFIVIGKEGIVVLFQRGAFDSNTTSAVYLCTSLYLFGMQFNVLRDMIYRYFYAVGNTKTPSANSMMVSILNIIISLVLVVFMGFYGVVIGTVASSIISTFVIYIRFSKKLGLGSPWILIVGKYFRNLIIAFISIIIVLITKYFLPISNPLVAIFVYGIQLVAVFFIIEFIFNRKIFLFIKEL